MPPLDHLNREGMAMTIVETRARSRAESTPIWMCTSPPRLMPTAACSASSRSRRRRPGSRSCTTWLVGVRHARPGRCGGHRRLRGRPGPATCAAAGVEVIEVDRPNRQARRRARQVRHARRRRSGSGGAVGPGDGGSPRPPMATWKRSGCCWSRTAPARDDAHQVPQPDPPSRLHRTR